MVDLLWSTGELRSVALLALALQARGVRATGVNVHQTGLSPTQLAPVHRRTRAPPVRARCSRSHDVVVVVPGFLARGDGDGDRVARPRRIGSDGRPPCRSRSAPPLRAHQGRPGLLHRRSRTAIPTRTHIAGSSLRRRARDGRRRMRARSARGAGSRARQHVAADRRASMAARRMDIARLEQTHGPRVG